MVVPITTRHPKLRMGLPQRRKTTSKATPTSNSPWRKRAKSEERNWTKKTWSKKLTVNLKANEWKHSRKTIIVWRKEERRKASETSWWRTGRKSESKQWRLSHDLLRDSGITSSSANSKFRRAQCLRRLRTWTGLTDSHSLSPCSTERASKLYNWVKIKSKIYINCIANS